ncbi:MAG: PIG-L family deacetylase [Chloroflexi bacterium]|nr:PIG-L family deacetylase [Chloroflexota bacterium]
MQASDFTYYDLRARSSSPDINLLFPAWRGAEERVMVLAPHDDDALLGAGYAMLATQANGAQVQVAICCDGSAGYSRAEQRDEIVSIRRRESVAAHGTLGLVDGETLHYLGFPDFSLVANIGWKLPSGGKGTLQPVIELLRKQCITRLMVPNGYREHSDHTAAWDIGRYDGVQAGDAVAVDWAPPTKVASTLQYSVWGDLTPEDALVHGDDVRIRANRALRAPAAAEELLGEALAKWVSQGTIIADLLASRRERAVRGGMLEVYLAFEARPKLEYGPYTALVDAIG